MLHQWRFMKTVKMNVFLLIVAFLWKCTGFELRKHNGPVKAILGKPAVLPCVVNEHINIELTKIVISWDYYDRKKENVLYYYEGLITKRIDNHTTLPEDSEIRNGNVSLIKKQVTKADEGTYSCEMDMDGDSKATTVELVVSVPLFGHNISCHPLQLHVDTKTYSMNVTCEAFGEKDISVSWNVLNNNGSKKSHVSKSDLKEGQTKVTAHFVLESAKLGEVVNCTVHNKGEESTRSCMVEGLQQENGVRHLGLILGISFVLVIVFLIGLVIIFKKFT
uniref:Ig-like domain-containing protein n=1 Tax=Eptatretus burgeri TaxID=7764 RepID=A0A8C4Q6M2_EPTBU